MFELPPRPRVRPGRLAGHQPVATTRRRGSWPGPIGRSIGAVILVLVLALAACVGVAVQEPPLGGSLRPDFQDRPPVRVVVMSAVPKELDLLLAASRVDETVQIAGRTHWLGNLEGHAVVLMLAGVSLVNAALSTQAVLDRFEVGGIVLSGIAGGVNPELQIGDVTVPAQWGQYQETVLAKRTPEGWDTGGRAGEFANFGMMFPRGQLLEGSGAEQRSEQRRFWFPVDERMLQTASELVGSVSLQRCAASGHCLEHDPRLVVGGNGVSGTSFVNNAAVRAWLWSTFEADAVDMETAAVAHVAFVNEVPFLAFRSLSDLAGGGPGANQIGTFGELAAANSATVLRAFLRQWRGPR